MKTGTAWRDITPLEPIPLGGQMRVRMGQYTHDPLTVNAVVFADETTQVGLVSCDLLGLTGDFIGTIKTACRKKYGLTDVLIACTHTHVGPCTTEWQVGEVKPAFMDSVQHAVVDAIGEAIGKLEETVLYAGTGFIEHMGWNRRGLRKDGTAEMYWGSWQKDFAGIEGPRDGQVPVIFARCSDGRVQTVIPSFSTHPNTVEGESFYSADLVGAMRRVIRAVLGDDVGVVYVTGAAGDTAPSVMENNGENRQMWRGEEGLQRSGQYLGAEVLKVIASTTDPMKDQTLQLAQQILKVPMRPWPEDFDPTVLRPGFKEFFTKSRDVWPVLMATESPIDVPVSVLRLGRAAICSNPGELYCQFGLDIKAHSPADVTIVSELTDGCVGYLPTPQAVLHGGYSAYPGLQCKLIPEAGHQVVDATRVMLAQVFSNAL